MKAKGIALVLAITALLAAAGCSAPKESGGKTAPEASSGTETSYVLPENLDYDGYNFNILITGNTENNWRKNDFAAEEQTGEILNDARYSRNLATEERFDIKIKTDEQYGSAKGAGSGFVILSQSALASDTAYDAAMVAGYDVCNLACSGYLSDLNSLPYLNLQNAWWDQKANDDMTIKGRMYFTTGDISTADNDATCCILFNKKLVADYNLSDPYAAVADGKWTFDYMTEMGKAVAHDIDGNGVYDKNDRYGSIVWDDTIMGVVNGAQIKCAAVSAEGEIELTLYSDKLIDVIKKYTDYVYDKSLCYNYQRVSYDITDPVRMFSGDQALFFMQMLDLVSYFRDMETDFGILPTPKYNENQQSYGHTIGSWHSVFLCVPAVLADGERSGAVLETLAYESALTVTPAYYEKTLIGKYFRDEQSADMLDIILSTRVYDLGWYYQIGKYNDEILYLVYETDTDFASRYAKYEQSALEDVKKINETFAAIIK